MGVLLLPLCIITTKTFLLAFDSASTSILESAPLWFFTVGAAIWLIVFWGLPRPLYLYVLGHEITHALFVWLCGGKVTEFKVHRDGGYIVTDKNNMLISLSPYFVPFYALVVILVFGIIGIWVDIDAYYPGALFWGRIGFSWSWILYALLGITCAFHFTFTAWMIFKDQPDLKQNGTFFSLAVIWLANILLLSAMLVLAEKSVTGPAFVSLWTDNAAKLMNAIRPLIGF